MDTYRQIFDKITLKLAVTKMEEFDIARAGEKRGYVFGLRIEPDKIEFEESTQSKSAWMDG